MPKVYSFSRASLLTFAASTIALAAIITPRLVEASTGSAVNITDPSLSSRKAKVTAAGLLQTAPCDSDSCAAVDAGRLRIGDGSGLLSVEAYPVLSRTFTFARQTSNTFTGIGGPVSGSTKRYITSIAVTNQNGGAAGVSFIARTASTDCTGGSTANANQIALTLAAGQTQQLTFPTPVNLGGACVTFFATGTYNVVVTGFLYP